MDSKGTQPYIYMCPFSPNSPPIQAAIQHWAEFHMLYSRFLLIIHFKYSSVYMLIPNFLTNPSPHPSLLATKSSISVCESVSVKRQLFLLLLHNRNDFLRDICYSCYCLLHFALLDVSLTNEALSSPDSATVTLKFVKICAAMQIIIRRVNWNLVNSNVC